MTVTPRGPIPHRVLIIGAGPGGLALAQSLRKHGVPFLLFERDESSTSRAQGFAITLHWTTIPQLLEVAPPNSKPLENLSVTFGTGKTDEAAYFDAYDKTEKGRSGDGVMPFLRVSRGRFRNWLLKDIEVQWGKRFVGYEDVEGGVVVKFEDGTEFAGTCIVGADGVNSRLRSALYVNNSLPPPEPYMLPVAVLAGECTLPRAAYERQFKNARSMYLVTADSFRFFIGLKEVSDDLESAEYYWLLRWVDDKTLDPSFWVHNATQKEYLDFCREKASKIHEDFSCLLDFQEEGRMLKPVIVKDLVPTPLPSDRVTLIGDSAHPMSNFRGEGANNAILDATLLGRHLATVFGEGKTETPVVAADITNVLRAYEQEMIPRATKAVLASREAAASMGLMLLGNFTKPATTDGVDAKSGAL